MRDVEPVSFATETWPLARTTHTCDGCRMPILKGERHSRWSVLHEGSWGTHRFHELCRILSGKLSSAAAALEDDWPGDVEFTSLADTADSLRDALDPGEPHAKVPAAALLIRWFEALTGESWRDDDA